MLLLETSLTALELFDDLLLVQKLLLGHLELLRTLLLGCVILGGYLQFEIIFLKLFDLFVKVTVHGVEIIDVFLLLGNELFVSCHQIGLLLFQFFDLLLIVRIFVVFFALKHFNFGL